MVRNPFKGKKSSNSFVAMTGAETSFENTSALNNTHNEDPTETEAPGNSDDDDEVETKKQPPLQRSSSIATRLTRATSSSLDDGDNSNMMPGTPATTGSSTTTVEEKPSVETVVDKNGKKKGSSSSPPSVMLIADDGTGKVEQPQPDGNNNNGSRRNRLKACLVLLNRDRFRSRFDGWTRRERILLTVATVNSILIVILFSVCIALAKQNNNGAGTITATSVASDPDLYRDICGTKPNDFINTTTTSSSDDGENNSGSTTTTDASSDSDNSSTTDTNVDDPPGDDEDEPPSTNDEEEDEEGTDVNSDPEEVEPPSDQDPVQADPDSLCGCPTCTESVWNNMAGQFTCGARILYLLETYPLLYPTQIHACRRVAFDHKCECGGCDPGRCRIPTPSFYLPDNWVPPSKARSGAIMPSPPPTPVPKLTNVRQEDVDLYCYPPAGQRTEYSLWGGMVVQVKEDSTILCGPGDNRFTTNTVQVNTDADTLTMQYKDGQASEVRILLPVEQRPFTYGTYSFSVKSVEVKNTAGTVVSNVLPKELVLGLFTWEPMEEYAVHENYNHEVDIEISRWGCATNSDLQFLVQPPGFPQMHRAFTGDPSATKDEQKFQQGGQVYEFTWEPARIDWETTAAGAGENSRFVLKTEEAVFREVPDYIQCLPDVGDNMEVRLNLWNMFGARPLEGLSFATVEVVIDNFSFTPSDKTHLPEGSICSKHCQCEMGAAECVGNVCTAL